MQLRIAHRRHVAPDVLELHLADPGGCDLPAWEPGAHIDIELPSGRVRSYSLCGDSADHGYYSIAVLREPEGRGGSVELHDWARTGRAVEVRPPINGFPLEPARRHLLIAGGIGITPFLPMVRRLREQGADFELHYCGRSRDRMVYLGELTDIADGQVSCVARDERDRLDIAALVAAQPSGTLIYCCGPDSMLGAVERAAAGLGRGADVRLERFGRPGPPTRRVDVVAAGLGADSGLRPALVPIDPDGPFDVALAASDITIRIRPGESILERVREVVPVDSSCTEGWCGTCETRVLAGVPDHRDDVLTDDERAVGETMMICVGRSRTAQLVLEL